MVTVMFEARRLRLFGAAHFVAGDEVVAFRFLRGLDAGCVVTPDPVVEGVVTELGRSPLLPGSWLHVRVGDRGIHWLRPVDVFHVDGCGRCAADLRAAHYDELAAAVEFERQGVDPHAVVTLRSWRGHWVHCAEQELIERVAVAG